MHLFNKTNNHLKSQLNNKIQIKVKLVATFPHLLNQQLINNQYKILNNKLHFSNKNQAHFLVKEFKTNNKLLYQPIHNHNSISNLRDFNKEQDFLILKIHLNKINNKSNQINP